VPAQLTEAIIRALSTPQSFERGRQYYRSGAVFNTSRQGDLLTGECEGSMVPTYRLRVELDGGGVRSASCTCPYDMGGYCKHIIALLLTYLNAPEEFIERMGIAEMLAELNHEGLVGLISQMLEHDPDLYGLLERAIPVASSSSELAESPPKEKRQTQVSAKAYQRKIRTILRSLDGYRMSEAYWMMGGMVQELALVADSAEAFLQAGDAEGAITILMVLLEEVADRYEQFDDSNGELGGFLDKLGLPLAEAFLSSELDEKERQKLIADLEPIVSELSEYGINGMEIALAALVQGWTGIEAGNEWATLGKEEWDDEIGCGWSGEVGLTQAKLNVLERQGQTEEYLRLCQQTCEYRRYALKLLEVGRNEETMLIALNHLSSVEDTLAVARKLRDMGQVWDAITIGERGLSLPGHKHSLGIWLGPLEEAQGRTDPAIQAYLAAFTSIPSLELYQTVMRLAGSKWNELQPKMMEILQAASHFSVLADVYLMEGDWDRAVQVADQAGFWSYSLIEQVADAVLSHRPDWVIRVSIKQAESLIEKTQSKYYHIAARWLLKAKMAYIASRRQSEWQAYISNLKTTYARRPALQRELHCL